MNEVLVYLLPVVFIIASLVFTVVFAGAIYLIIKKHFAGGESRRLLFQEFAKRYSLTFSGDNTPAVFRGYEYFRVFNMGNSYGRRIENLVSGELNGFQVMVFDSVYYVFKKLDKQTVFMFQSPKLNLPLFSFQPKRDGLSRMLGKILRDETGIVLGENFFNGYEIVGQNETYLRQTFTPQILSSLKTIEGVNVEGGGNRIFFYRLGRQLTAQELDRMIGEGMKIARLFQEQR